jgi:hypothetical protein
MKTSRIVSLCLLSVLFAFSAFAQRPAKIKSINPAELTKIVKSKVTYPEFAIENNLTGFVVVELKVKDDGSIAVERINSIYPELSDYVIGKLEKAKVKNPQELSGKSYYYRFDFELL